MPEIASALAKTLKGRVSTDPKDLQSFSHDASLFEVQPTAVVSPETSQDICYLVQFVKAHKKIDPKTSLTARSGGTDMSGGAINDSIIISLDSFDHIGPVDKDHISVEPGVYYRDFEKVTLAAGLLMPSYPASREICKLGGMIANNAGGEKSLIYGKTDRYVSELKVVLVDGQEHIFRPLSGPALKAKLRQTDFEGQIYQQIFKLVNQNSQLIKRSKPKVTKNSTGYNLWDVWDGQTLDLTKLIVGSQGTLGIVTQATFKLIKAKPLSGMVVAFLAGLDHIGQITNELLKLGPTSLESFDDRTLKLAFRFFLSFRKTLGWKRFVLLGLSFVPLLGKLLKYLFQLPKIILLIEFEGETQSEVEEKLRSTRLLLKDSDIDSQVAADRHQEEKFWIIRRESFNLLRKNIKRKHTAPFIDDLIVAPASLPDFLPKLTEILDRYQLKYAVAGHMGDGNFHIIPMMDLNTESERNKIYPVLNEVSDLVLRYDGSLSGEHNDGLIRGPLLRRMYEPEMMSLFKEVKKIFDPDNIFNPHKKTDATLEFSEQHIRRQF